VRDDLPLVPPTPGSVISELTGSSWLRQKRKKAVFQPQHPAGLNTNLQFNYGTVFLKINTVREMVHQKNTSSVGFFNVFGRRWIRNVFIIKTGTLISDFAGEFTFCSKKLHHNFFIGILFIAMGDGIVYSLGNSDENISVMFFAYSVLRANFIDSLLYNRNIFNARSDGNSFSI